MATTSNVESNNKHSTLQGKQVKAFLVDTVNTHGPKTIMDKHKSIGHYCSIQVTQSQRKLLACTSINKPSKYRLKYKHMTIHTAERSLSIPDTPVQCAGEGRTGWLYGHKRHAVPLAPGSRKHTMVCFNY